MKVTHRFIRPAHIMVACLFTLLLLTKPLPAEVTEFETATEMISSGRYLEAIGVYKEIQKTTPEKNVKARALFFTASVYDHYLDQPETAIEYFQTLIDTYPESSAAPDALFNSGRILYATDRYTESYRTFNSYLKRYPDSIRRQSAIAWIENARNAIKIKPDPKPATPPHLTVSDHIRVLIQRDAQKLIFNSQDILRISDPATNTVVLNTEGPLILTRSNNRIVLNNTETGLVTCRIEADRSPVSMDGVPYRGAFSVHSKNTGLTAVNHLHIENYLYGVVPKEMSWLWSEQALMAQAIASRTYALYIRDKQPLSSLYDLEATTASQVYGGIDVEKQQSSDAVDATSGKIITYKNKLIIAYFHANSGGHTESSKNVWGAELPYLQSKNDDFSTILPESVWEYHISYGELQSLFRHSNYRFSRITKITFGKKTSSGRILSFLLSTDKGPVRLSGNNFRLILGPTNLKSTLFQVFQEKKGLRFKGKGYGHGVGMSQWGAHRMAQAGYPYSAILKHYYCGVNISHVRYL